MRSLYESIAQSHFTRHEIGESITRSRFTRREIDESILDTDIKTVQDVTSTATRMVEDFLKTFPYAKFCKFETKGDRLIVTCTASYAQFKKYEFLIDNGKVLNISNLLDLDNTIGLKLFDYVDFVDCEIYVNYEKTQTPEFLKHCTRCKITLEGDGRFKKETATYLKQSKNCTLYLPGTKITSFLYDYSDYNGMDFSDHHVIIYQSAVVGNIKNISAKSILFQPSNKWNIEDKSNIIDTDIDSDYFYECLDKFVAANPGIKSLGIICHHVQYAYWYTKSSGKWEHQVVPVSSTRVPKVK